MVYKMTFPVLRLAFILRPFLLCKKNMRTFYKQSINSYLFVTRFFWMLP
jgi:hypothetical protein